MLKKLLVALLACVTIFLSRRALIEPHLRAGSPAEGDRGATAQAERGGAASDGAAVAYGAGGSERAPALTAIRAR
ncbi:MAG: hypothetical protein KF894_04985 [Labilithrix sp.]|nr:hypothetical protein [Labilithrix sp.]